MNDGSPALSVILPVHRVQGYLQQCLDSILVPGCDYLELIAVNDCSPDSCGDILDEYGERDPRVRVLHLDHNVGLGAARNIGLREATGDYVWFFDSDDYATDGAVQAIYERLIETKPDVLVFDYARGYWNGKIQRSVINDLFRDPPPPDVFTLAERPSAMQLMMTAWNKAIRREFLLDLGLTFSDGYYEDLNVTYPILMAAERISLLDRLCYVYRQRRSGAITKTASERHFDAFPQYERVFAFMDAGGPAMDQFRRIMFDRMIWHLMVILRQRARVPGPARKRFFAEMSRLYNRYVPAGHVPAGRRLAANYLLIRRNRYRTFELLRRIGRIRRYLRAGVRFARRLAGALTRLGKRRLRGLYYRVQLRLPMDERLVVYAAYWYRGYSCNPAAIYEKARELAPHLRGVWVVRRGAEDTVPPGVDYVVAGGRAYLRAMARAKYFVNNVNFPTPLVKRRGSVHLQTQHGTPLKKMGLDQMDFPIGAADMDFEALITRSDRWDFLISANPLSSQAWERSFPCRYEMLEIGYPRNDRLVRATDDERRRLRAELGIPEGRKAVFYAPTHRDYRRDYRPMFDLRRFVGELGKEYVVLLRTHYFYDQIAAGEGPESVIDVSGHPSVEDLCIASDALLTDYSSIMFDYANLDRPIVIHAGDWETYRLTRGVNFDITAQPPGVVATTEEELIDAFRTGAAWSDHAAKVRADFRARFCPWDDGNAAERAVRRVFLGEEVDRPR
jgi:CDP-glycerol glycerophosphotransferase